MKKLFLLFALIFVTSSVAQNIQLHYDLGKDREYFTTTLEMFKPDEYGATFFFVDFDYNAPGNKSIALAYFEIARYITIPGAGGLAGTIQYNDGTAPWGPLGHIVLAGASYPIDLGFVTLNTDLLFRKDYLSNGSDVQLTTVWFVPFFEGKLIFTGFLDLWTGEYWYTDGKEVVLLTEPQLWFNIDNHLSIGGEVELSNNFLPLTDGIQVNPTLGLKWNF
ncbi:MAG: DUF5020 family protein [Ignavibacteriales bacterium]|nr:DUF5020 family protein [Ignavibacteriales bacterium]MCB9218909.1 DUF5020 family protein [Ignavibacteriales bacterium]